jgi:integrase
METILFFIKRRKLLKDGTASIFVRVTSQRLSAEVATGKSVMPTQWVATKGRAKGNNLKNKQINAFLVNTSPIKMFGFVRRKPNIFITFAVEI